MHARYGRTLPYCTLVHFGSVHKRKVMGSYFRNLVGVETTHGDLGP